MTNWSFLDGVAMFTGLKGAIAQMRQIINGSRAFYIIGVGHDICDQRRIASWPTFGDRFTTRIYSAAEQAELALRQNRAAYLAGRFAVKEAVYKALSATEQAGMRTLRHYHQLQERGLTFQGSVNLVSIDRSGRI